METSPIQTQRTQRRVFQPTAGSVRAGRDFVRQALSAWGLEGQLDTTILLASETVANAVVHAATPFIVDVFVTDDRREFVVAVTDFCDRPVLSPIAALGLRSLLDDPDLDAESGRGLVIVATLADRWGIDPCEQGKTVWFSLPLTF